ncbi:MAG: hypothetical protein PW845_28195 [Pseudomonas sp.]|uniref:hypothetical protein n=1 Tax=Pseudomonas abieticivorans TaxID=2931382 RepID=UPI0020BE9412|nr:hypothetical protein [Pseudomonas sp. PIA16]MDE1169161.1 hypothetical protein [Pseudomonas sp.]
MNLNNQPTTEQLAQLFAARKDTLDSHILWVCESGEVHIDCLECVTQESEFEQQQPSMRARFKMYRRGQGYVGKKAAADKDYVGRVLQTLKHEWSEAQGSSRVHVIDRLC